MTVQELLNQHFRVMRLKADMDDVNFLYGGDDQPMTNMRETFYEGALKKYLEATTTMKNMMAKATPEVLEEARRLAKEQKLIQKTQVEDK